MPAQKPVERPLSPHLQIYRPQLIEQVCHSPRRITAALAVAAIAVIAVIAAATLAAAYFTNL